MKILLAIDDSKFSEEATQAVLDRFKPQNVDVHVLTVVDLVPHFMSHIGTEEAAERNIPDITELRLARLNRASKLVERARQRLQRAGFKTSVGVAEGEPKTRIIEESEQWGADLIVVGSHGRNDFNRAMLGSVSEAVARYARCSVEIVRIRHKK
jgi:nucleotide-binding universal stress UspA family protein